jgi:hypothetical protein
MRGARIAGAISDNANRYGQLLMQLIARQDEQKRFDAEKGIADTRYNEGIAYRNKRDEVEDTRANETAITNATLQGAKPARPVGEMLMGMSSVGPLPSPVLHSDVTATPMKVGGQDMIMPKREPLANLSRGGMSVQGVPMSQASSVMQSLPTDAPEPTGMTEYQRAQIGLDRDRLALDRDKLAREGSPAGAVEPEDPAIITLRSLAANPSPAGDVAFGYAFMKLLESKGMVTAQELGMVSKAGSLKERLKGLIAKAQTGEQFTPEIRNDFLRQAEAIVGARSAAGAVPQTGGRSSGAGGPPPAGDVWTRIQNDPSLTPQEKADLLRRRKQ